MDFEKEYQDACAKDTDIHEHLPVLSELTSQCTHVTELGVGWAQSTRAFLRHDIELHSYEFMPLPGIREFFEEAKNAGRNVTLHVDDTRKVEITETDLLFVDSLHIYEQVQKELELHANKARKFIGFHDTTTFEYTDETNYEELGDDWKGEGIGIWKAIE
jgi:hypothetical protein